MMYEVSVGKIDSIEKRDISYRYFIDDSSLKDIIGIKHNNKIYDIENGISYQIIKRNKRGFIDNNQDILINENYALYIKEHKDYTLNEYLKAFKLQLALKRQKRYMFDNSVENTMRQDYKKLQKR